MRYIFTPTDRKVLIDMACKYNPSVPRTTFTKLFTTWYEAMDNDDYEVLECPSPELEWSFVLANEGYENPNYLSEAPQ